MVQGAYELWTGPEMRPELQEHPAHLPLPGAEIRPQGSRSLRGSVTTWQHLAQGVSGIVLFGLLTRMFTYKPQVILSPSGVS